jgi:hypothetical protein
MRRCVGSGWHMARMDCYRITFIRFSGTEGDILLRLPAETLSLHRDTKLPWPLVVRPPFTPPLFLSLTSHVTHPLGWPDALVRSIGWNVKDQIRGSSPSAESRSDIAEAALATETQALVFPAHNAREDRARYARATHRAVWRHRGTGGQAGAYTRARALWAEGPPRGWGRERATAPPCYLYTPSEKKFLVFSNPWSPGLKFPGPTNQPTLGPGIVVGILPGPLATRTIIYLPTNTFHESICKSTCTTYPICPPKRAELDALDQKPGVQGSTVESKN